MITWPESLVQDIARRRAILFLGSGVSKNSVSQTHAERSPPTWEEFLRIAVDRCSSPTKHIRSLLNQRDYLTACEVIKTKLGNQWNSLIHELFVAPRFQAAGIHRDIFKLDSRIVLTQNVDKIYDTFASNESSGTVYVKEYSKADIGIVVRGDRRCVLKAHGTVDTPNEMIFTRSEYTKARYAYASFYGLLDALALTHTILFVGCGISDPDVQLMLERQSSMYPENRPHFMVAPRSAFHPEVAQSYRRTMNLEILLYNQSDKHAELRDSLPQLVSQVEACRDEFARARDW